MRDEFYEGSVGPQNEKSQKTFYVFYNVLFIISIIAFVFTFYLWFMIGDLGFVVLFCISLVFAVIFFFIRRKLYLFFDYTYISGEVRIIKVVNGKTRRKFLFIDCKSISQVGKVGSQSFTKLYESKQNKLKIATPNGMHAEKQLYYILAMVNGENVLAILECEETLLAYIVSYRGKTVLEKDYK